MIDLIQKVQKILEKQEKEGFGKLKGVSKIYQIEETEPFVDRKVVFLPACGKAIFVGDLHGDFKSLKEILAESSMLRSIGKNAQNLMYLVFLGDYVDRGPKQVEVLKRVLELKYQSPFRVYLLRGNHEQRGDVSPHDFPDVAGPKLYDIANDLFDKLPYVVITKNGLVALHGGICQGVKKLEDLTRLSQEQKEEILWNDPNPVNGENFTFNYQRGIGNLFSQKALEEFLENIGAEILLRSHQIETQNSKLKTKNLLITIFSNTYGGLVPNPSYAVLDLEKEPELEIRSISH